MMFVVVVVSIRIGGMGDASYDDQGGIEWSDPSEKEKQILVFVGSPSSVDRGGLDRRGHKFPHTIVGRAHTRMPMMASYVGRVTRGAISLFRFIF
jgi:hypothetical protein